MRVAVITPYYKESLETLIRCRDSVKNQTYKNTTHILVADGHSNSICKGWNVDHFELPVSHADAGATPRAVAAMSAFSRGYDAIAFLDADNWYDNDHIESMVEGVHGVKQGTVDFVIATRRIHCSLTEKMLYVDTIESNGTNMVDTNCMFMTKTCLNLLPNWIVDPANRLISDKIFWESVKKNNVSIVRYTRPTVSYSTKWAWHYKQAGVEIPPDAVWLMQDNKGNKIHVKHKETKEYHESRNLDKA